MSQVDAVYQEGVFKPLGDVSLPENQRVRLHFETVQAESWRAWIEQSQALHRQILDRRGPLPDSTPDIAEDRMRDV